MPYQMTWVPAPKDENLVVHKEKLKVPCYECRFCGGWIEGSPSEYREDSIGPLSGRRGTARHCCRCGSEISFFGMYS